MTPIALFCNDYRVGDLADAFCTDETWYASLRLTLQGQSGFEQRIHSFIALCVDWHDRIDSDPDAAEFEAFDDVVNQSAWFIMCDDGTRHLIHAAPVFLADGEISWRPV